MHTVHWEIGKEFNLVVWWISTKSNSTNYYICTRSTDSYFRLLQIKIRQTPKFVANLPNYNTAIFSHYIAM